MNSNTVSFAPNLRPDHYEPLTKILPLAEPIQNLVLSGARESILQIVGKTKGRVLDVCCGTGCLSRLLSDAGHEVVGVDSSATMLNRAIKNQRASELILLDATKMNFQAEFDAAVISLSLHEMEPCKRDVTWRKIQEAVKPGGRIIAMDYAASGKPTIFSRFVGYLMKLDEKRFRKINPAHYENYLQFMAEGGIESWVKRRKESIEEARFYLCGAIGVLGVCA